MLPLGDFSAETIDLSKFIGAMPVEPLLGIDCKFLSEETELPQLAATIPVESRLCCIAPSDTAELPELTVFSAVDMCSGFRGGDVLLRGLARGFFFFFGDSLDLGLDFLLLDVLGVGVCGASNGCECPWFDKSWEDCKLLDEALDFLFFLGRSFRGESIGEATEESCKLLEEFSIDTELDRLFFFLECRLGLGDRDLDDVFFFGDLGGSGSIFS